MSIFGIFSKPTNDITIEEAISKRYAESGEYTRNSICEEVVAHLAQYDSDDDAMKVIGVSYVRAWSSNLSPKWLKLLAKLRETRQARAQVAVFLDLLSVAARAGWEPDVEEIRGSGASQYFRAGGTVYKCWTLLMASRDHRTYTIEAQGDAYEIMRAFIDYREMNQKERVPRALMLLSPGNWIAARWKP